MTRASPKHPRKVVAHPTDPTLALVELTRGFWAVIDSAHSERVSQFNWCANSRGTKTMYAETNRNPITGRRGSGSLHRFIAILAGVDATGLVDHKNGNGLDCRASNLRPATKVTNAWNRGLDRNNRTGVKGVHFEAFTGRYRAEIWVGNKHLRLGRFETVAEAEAVVLAARREHHGEFANDGKGMLQ